MSIDNCVSKPMNDQQKDCNDPKWKTRTSATETQLKYLNFYTLKFKHSIFWRKLETHTTVPSGQNFLKISYWICVKDCNRKRSTLGLDTLSTPLIALNCHHHWLTAFFISETVSRPGRKQQDGKIRSRRWKCNFAIASWAGPGRGRREGWQEAAQETANISLAIIIMVGLYAKWRKQLAPSLHHSAPR